VRRAGAERDAVATEAEPRASHAILPGSAGLALLALFVGTYVLPLGVRPLFRPDEDRYAEIPREMLASGDWVVPHLNGIPYLEKPALGYWLGAISIRAFGHNPFAVRLPAALSAGVSASPSSCWPGSSGALGSPRCCLPRSS
jgi:4-amino-4-deoxy-L-arabinose transferase-like glycosyltransferase